MKQKHEEAETRIRDACEAADFDAATTLVIETYGSEILSFLMARLGTGGAAQEAFSMFAEDLWSGLSGFAFRCSVRTWSYTLARNAAARYVSAPQNRKRRNLTLSKHAEISQLVEQVRTATQAHQRTEVKDRVRALREQLEPDDQMLLVLRVDRGMSWRDLSLAMSGNVELDEGNVDREAARLRKRFERIKTELRRMAEAEGLIPRQD